MKKCALLLMLSLLGTACSFAQRNNTGTDATNGGPSLGVPAGSRTSLFAADPTPAGHPSPKPKFFNGEREDPRWQLSMGYTYFRLRSPLINANLNGVNTTVVYYTNAWLGLEGSFTAAFSPFLKGFDREHGKIAVITGGPRIAWRKNKWEPWGHFLVGMVHLQPQLGANLSPSALAYSAGGGANYHWRPKISFRLQGDWVRTQLFNQGQNNFQVSSGVVLHF